MKVELYKQYLRMNRRTLLQGAAAGAALGTIGRISPAFAQDDLRAELARIPGVGNGEPGEAEWQRVGELCLGPTKQNHQPGEFEGVELTFMGLNTQNLHVIQFRAMLRPWEDYTGAKITYIDLNNPQLNERIQHAIARQSIEFDIVEMPEPFMGDTAGRGMLSEMPDWVARQIEMDDYVDYLKAPIGTWEGKIHRISIDGDTHLLNYRTDVFSDPALAEQWAAHDDKAGLAEWGLPDTWEQVTAATKFLKGKQLNGQDLFGYVDAVKPWGGWNFHFLASRAAAYTKYPGDPAWMFDPETMKPRINNPGWVRAIQDIVDCLPHEPSDQVDMDGMGTGFTQFLGGTGSMVAWWGDIGSNAMTNAASVVGDTIAFSLCPGSDDVYNANTQEWETLSTGRNHAPNMAAIGLGLYVTTRADSDERRRKAAWSAVAHLGGKDISLWQCLYPSGGQPYRNSQLNPEEWVAAGYDRRFAESYLRATQEAYNHPNAAIEARIPGAQQYYSIADDNLALIFAGTIGVQEGADAIAAAWEELTDQLGRENQIKLYKVSLGLA